MNYRGLVLCVPLVALALTACSGTSEPQPTVTVTEPGPTVTVTESATPEAIDEETSAADEMSPDGYPIHKVGKTVTFEGMTLTVKSAKVLDALPQAEGGPVKAEPGEQFVLVKTEFVNNSQQLVDLSCSGMPTVYMQGWDTENREMARVFEDYKLKGNPECNKNLLQGQSHSWSFAFRTVEGAVPSHLSLMNSTSFDDAVILLLKK
ncbi:hypothetical protein [Timonella senegalensis]|uniref:hypothetical protein n=1 Tax=Timonella senegalensis TaxID=1465825 RepID=UPI002FDDA564